MDIVRGAIRLPFFRSPRCRVWRPGRPVHAQQALQACAACRHARGGLQRVIVREQARLCLHACVCVCASTLRMSDQAKMCNFPHSHFRRRRLQALMPQAARQARALGPPPACCDLPLSCAGRRPASLLPCRAGRRMRLCPRPCRPPPGLQTRQLLLPQSSLAASPAAVAAAAAGVEPPALSAATAPRTLATGSATRSGSGRTGKVAAATLAAAALRPTTAPRSLRCDSHRCSRSTHKAAPAVAALGCDGDGGGGNGMGGHEDVGEVAAAGRGGSAGAAAFDGEVVAEEADTPARPEDYCIVGNLRLVRRAWQGTWKAGGMRRMHAGECLRRMHAEECLRRMHAGNACAACTQGNACAACMQGAGGMHCMHAFEW
eukprot:363766-Chlamydomonas_euryale.AAC.7